MNDLSARKKRARSDIRAARTRRVPLRPERDQRIQANLLAALADLPEDTSDLTIAAFVPLADEPGGGDLHTTLATTGARVLLPRVSRGDTPRLEWVEFQPDSPNLAPGTWGILEPIGNAIHNFPACANVIITPGLSIDYHGKRLGQGGGFYDRALANRPAHVKVWALIDHEEFTRDVPSQDHDLVVDAVLNDLGFFPII